MTRPYVVLELHQTLAPPSATAGTRVYSLLPTLDMLLHRRNFGGSRPIAMPGTRPSFDPWVLWNGHRVRTH